MEATARIIASANPSITHMLICNPQSPPRSLSGGLVVDGINLVIGANLS